MDFAHKIELKGKFIGKALFDQSLSNRSLGGIGKGIIPSRKACSYIIRITFKEPLDRQFRANGICFAP